jgi:hypothetical protein
MIGQRLGSVSRPNNSDAKSGPYNFGGAANERRRNFGRKSKRNANHGSNL